MAKKGRPSRYTKAVAKEILKRMSYGESLSAICREERMPSRPTVLRWVVEDYHGFSDGYAKAWDLRLSFMADELIDIADDSTNDYMQKEGKDVLNAEAVSRSRLRVDTRKWMLCKLVNRFKDNYEEPKNDDKEEKFVYVTSSNRD